MARVNMLFTGEDLIEDIGFGEDGVENSDHNHRDDGPGAPEWWSGWQMSIHPPHPRYESLSYDGICITVVEDSGGLSLDDLYHRDPQLALTLLRSFMLAYHREFRRTPKLHPVYDRLLRYI